MRHSPRQRVQFDAVEVSKYLSASWGFFLKPSCSIQRFQFSVVKSPATLHLTELRSSRTCLQNRKLLFQQSADYFLARCMASKKICAFFCVSERVAPSFRYYRFSAQRYIAVAPHHMAIAGGDITAAFAFSNFAVTVSPIFRRKRSVKFSGRVLVSLSPSQSTTA